MGLDFKPHLKVELGGVDITSNISEANVDLGDVIAVGSSQSGKDAVVRTASIYYFEEELEVDMVEPMTPIKIKGFREDLSDPIPEGDPIPFVEIFEGYVDANRVQYPRNIIECTDGAKILQNAFILDEREYPKYFLCEYVGGTLARPLWDVLQEIINDELGAGQVTVYSPNGGGEEPINEGDFSYTPHVYWLDEKNFIVEYQTVWDALQECVLQVGFFLGYRWHEPTDSFQLILMEPPINKQTADYNFTWTSDFYIHEYSMSDENIRNFVRVTYDLDFDGDRIYVDNDHPGVGAFYKSLANTSISKYGKRAMEIEEGDSSLLYSEDQAVRLVEYALNDLTRISGNSIIDMPFMPQIDLFDTFTVIDPRYQEEPLFYAVDSIRHSLTFGDNPRARTEVQCSEQIVSKKEAWALLDAREGKEKPEHPISDVMSKKKLRPPQNAEMYLQEGAVVFEYDELEYQPHVRTEVHMSTTEGFQPTTGTLKHFTRDNIIYITEGLETNTEYWGGLRYVDPYGQKSSLVRLGPVQVGDLLPVTFDEILWGADYLGISWTISSDFRYDSYELRTDKEFGREHAMQIIVDLNEEIEDISVNYCTPESTAISYLTETIVLRDLWGALYTVELQWSIENYNCEFPGEYTAIGVFEWPEELDQTDPPISTEVETTVTVLEEEVE